MKRARKPFPDEVPTRRDLPRAKESGVHEKPKADAEPRLVVEEVDATTARDPRRES